MKKWRRPWLWVCGGILLCALQLWTFAFILPRNREIGNAVKAIRTHTLGPYQWTLDHNERPFPTMASEAEALAREALARFGIIDGASVIEYPSTESFVNSISNTDNWRVRVMLNDNSTALDVYVTKSRTADAPTLVEVYFLK